MNERFKFRVWNGKEMLYKGGLGYDGNQLIEDRGHIIMQSTGLKDKNGKLIYEGDIVKVKGKQTDETIGFIEWLNDFGKFSLNVDSCCIYTDFDYLPEKEIEIIGNIYEKKELLKEQK